MTALSTSIQSVLTIVLLIVVGYVLRRQGRFDDQFGKTISDLLMKIALPASIFISVLQRLTLDKLVSLSSGLVYGFGAVILGYRMAGVLGTLVALVATVLPCLITLTIISYSYDYFIQNAYIKMVLRGMQCGATALIVNVGIDLLVKQGKKKLILPMLIIIGTFVANLFFDTNIMVLILIDGIIGFLFMRDALYN